MLTAEKGNISIHTENIFPIIKKFLYSDHEIFLRELVSNAVDATQKLKRLSNLGQVNQELGDLKVTVMADKEKGTLTISDRGIGMTAEEIKKYINQIAFSGAQEFVEKYKGSENPNEQIIGHFGLGFYSAFMVAKQVEIQTLSHQEGAVPARWICDGSTEFEITEGSRQDRGTDIILHLDDESKEFLDTWKLREILNKYCKFLPIPVFLNEWVTEQVKPEGQEDDKDAPTESVTKLKENEITDTTPLWTKAPSTLTDEDYLEFYRKLYPMAEEPLFWVHLNVEHPFQLTGILYFPKIKPEMDPNKHKIQLYSRQVFITDELKGVVPEFLMLLHGVIDSPDIPLNVSRSYLQADKQVKSLSNHITKKVADKLADIFSADRSNYESKWESLALFVKYGVLVEQKFADRAKEFLLLTNTQGVHRTLNEYREHIQVAQTDKSSQVIGLYTTDAEAQHLYVHQATKAGYDVLKFEEHPVDQHFITRLEDLFDPRVSLKRVDAAPVEKLIEKEIAAENLLTEEQISNLKTRFTAATGVAEADLSFEPQSAESLPVSLVQDEWMRRMKIQFASMGNLGGMDMDKFRVVVNTNHPAIPALLDLEETAAHAKIQYFHDLAQLAQGTLKGEKLTGFIERAVAQA